MAPAHRMLLPLVAVAAACAPIRVFEDPTKVPPERTDTDVSVVVDDTSPPFVPRDTGLADDQDQDGVVDDDDNCVREPNPDQADLDGDLLGDACDEDRDGDTIPNHRDLFADDGDQPGVASQDHVYAHGPYDLWRFDVPSRTLQAVGPFTFDQNGGSITDVAIDRYGVLYAVSFSNCFVCNPYTAECWRIGPLPGSYNGLTFVPDDLGQADVLIGIANAGSWTSFPDVPFGMTPGSWGGYGPGYSSSGDAFHVRNTGTFAAVNGPNSGVDIVETDIHGQIFRTVATLTGMGGIYGIGGWSDTIFAFASSGAIIEMKPATGDWWVIANGPGWWGAGVKTIVVP